MKKAIYAGSFDPIHQGHLAIIDKSLLLFDFIYVIVSVNPDKNNLDNIDVRTQDVKNVLKNYKNVVVIQNKDDLIANLAKDLDVHFLIRSARNQSDYEYELVVAAANHSLNHDLETILILPDYKNIEYSSTLIRHRKKLGK
ncbi:UNVERIFIED_CONTAM: pantetheine-phosphate adenylyltransferase [Campylobacter lari]